MEGRGNFIDTACAKCGEEQPIYRCQSCAFGHMLCKKCIVKTHALNPLHVIKVLHYGFWHYSQTYFPNRHGPMTHTLVGCP
jgi:hypothetical protein